MEGPTDETSDMEVSTPKTNDTEGSELEGGGRTLVRNRRGSRSQSRSDGWQFNDRNRDFIPRDKTCSHQDRTNPENGRQLQRTMEIVSGQREQEVLGGTETARMEIEQVPDQVLPDQPIYP
ncbi:hypothetical protein LWI28_014974 [Acer negundo]|uniref:Uncharacterized protein n=1 Tax=Acer negundo TaxID=4023 RepID=A0AAD5J6E4_ACENE|nr:hypothetical protein LWI28_014974 [Acer negundo]